MFADPSSSPNRRGVRDLYDDRFDPEFNRALARELYVDSTVNVVNAKRNSPGKVKPGQMNFFNPKGQKDLTVEFIALKESIEKEGSLSPNRTNRSQLDQITNIMQDDGGKVKMRNSEL